MTHSTRLLLAFALSPLLACSEKEPTDDTGAPAFCPCDASISKTAASSFSAGGDALYGIQVSWTGHEDCVPEGPLCFTDKLPEGITYASTTGDFTCTGDAVIECCTDSAPPADLLAQYVALIGVHVDPTLSGEVENCASLPGGDSYAGNDTSCVTVDVAAYIPQVDLALSKSGDGVFTPGTTGTYTLAVSNAGSDLGTNLVLTDTLPPGLSLAEASPYLNGGWTCDSDGLQPETITCTLDELAGGDSSLLELPVAVDPWWTGEDAVENCATVQSDDPDLDDSDNSDCFKSEVDAVVVWGRCGTPSEINTCTVALDTGAVTCDGSSPVTLVSSSSGFTYQLDMSSWSMVRAEAVLDTPTGWALHLANSPTNNGYSGDQGDFIDDSEAQLKGTTLSVYENDLGTLADKLAISQGNADSPASGEVVATVCDSYFRWQSDSTDVSHYDETTIFQIDGDENGATNDQLLWLGIDRVIDLTTEPTRTGSGVVGLTLVFGS